MARIQISAEDVSNPNHEVFVGYDSPFESYFAQVYDQTLSEDENPVYWVGTEVREIKSIYNLAIMLEPFCTLSEDMRAKLKADFDNRTEPTALQKWGRSL